MRLVIAGGVDDGKSTLIGRLLFEAGALREDELAAVQKASRRSDHIIDFSLLTDGLESEREQSITIDVAYRYFGTRRKQFIIADCPGHRQYTHNMVTGASTAEAALLVVDARKGSLEQTRRHAFVAWMLGIRNFVVAINKMDLVDFHCDIFESVRNQLSGQIASFMKNGVLHFVPVSALHGDNVSARSQRLSWYKGAPLLRQLEELSAEDQQDSLAFRFPIQTVIRPNQEFRGYAGQIVSGVVRRGQQVLALPSLQRATIREIHVYTQTLEKATAPMCACLTFCDDIALGRGEMLADPQRPPTVSKRLVASLIWMSQTPMALYTSYLIKHTTRTVRGNVVTVRSKLDFNSLGYVPTDTLTANDVGSVELEMHTPLFCDTYKSNRATGRLLIINPYDNNTLAAGLITEVYSGEVVPSIKTGSGRNTNPRQEGLTVWFTGLSAAGKTTICKCVHAELTARGYRTEILDGDDLRKHLNRGLGFSKEDRDENVRRIGFIAELLTRNGIIALVAAISPYRAVRNEVRRRIGRFIEVYVDSPLAVCEERDPKGLYKKARKGELPSFTGVDDPYEIPLEAEIRCETDRETLEACTKTVLTAVLYYIESNTDT
jgi:bifunctional enzyme CysN/CysC